MIQPDIFINNIGRCMSCYRAVCAKPKSRQRYPYFGCADWQDESPVNWDEPSMKTIEVENNVSK